MQKRFSVLFLIFAVILSGTAGFWGAYLVNNLMSTAPEAVTPSAPASAPVSNWNTEELHAYIDAYLAASEINAETQPVDSNGEADRQQAAEYISARDALTIPEIAALASDSVVEVYTESVVSGGRMWQYVTGGAGSGVIISGDGYIVTNNHVIEGASRIHVQLNDGSVYEAALIGRDSRTDIAVLRIGADELQPAAFGDSDTLAVGELAVAIGNPLGELGGTLSEGIISALSRKIDIDGYVMDLLQTTAAVNPGNSGGGLFNRYGRLIGVVVAKSGGSDIEGIGFAIPVNTVRAITDELIEFGYVPGRIDFGATLIDILDSRTAVMYRVQTTGVYVSRADDDSPLQAGDRIISIDGTEITSEEDVRRILDEHTAGDMLSIVVARRGAAVSLNLTLKQALS